MLSVGLAIAFSLSTLTGDPGGARVGTCDAAPAYAPPGAHHARLRAPQDSDVVVVTTERKVMCPGGSFHVTLRNRSSAKRDLKLCIMKDSGKWDCKESNGVGAGRTWSYWACTASGSYWFTSRAAESKDPFGDPPNA